MGAAGALTGALAASAIASETAQHQQDQQESPKIANGTVLEKITPDEAEGAYRKLLANVTYVQRVVVEHGRPAVYDVAWIALAVLSGVVPTGLRVIAKYCPSPGDIYQYIDIGVGVTKFTCYWNYGNASVIYQKTFTAP